MVAQVVNSNNAPSSHRLLSSQRMGWIWNGRSCRGDDREKNVRVHRRRRQITWRRSEDEDEVLIEKYQQQCNGERQHQRHVTAAAFFFLTSITFAFSLMMMIFLTECRSRLKFASHDAMFTFMSGRWWTSINFPPSLTHSKTSATGGTLNASAIFS